MLLKVNTALAVLLCLFFLSACSESNRTTIAFGLNTAPVTLDPRFATDAVSYRISRLIYKSLIDFDEQFNVIPDLAIWEQIALDHYRFTLGSDNREFHNGERLTAEDVKATYESVLDMATISPHRGSVQMIESIEVIDEDTIDFRLAQNDPLFPGRLVIGVLPKELIAKGHDFKQEPIGSGPMRFLEWQDDSNMSLLRLSDQQVISFSELKDPTVRVLKLLRGEIDLIQGNLPPEIVKWLDETKSIHIKKKRGDLFAYIGFNLEDKDTKKLEVRTAIARAINRESMIKHLKGESARKAGAILPPGHWASAADLEGIDYDLVKAKALLAQAGYSASKPLKLTYKTTNNPDNLRLATVIQDQLKAADIELEIRSYDWGTFYGDVKAGNFQMYSLGWVGLKMPDIFRYALHSDSIPPNGANRGRFIDTYVDATIEKAELEPDLSIQAAYYRELQHYLLEALPYIPLWYEDNIMAMNDSIKGYRLSLDGNYDALINTKRTIH